jgi:hypothetical protein
MKPRLSSCSMSALRSPMRALVLVAGLGLGSSAACGSDPTPRGYHSPSVAWSDDELGLVWLVRRAPSEAVMFARAGEDAKPKAKAVELSHDAWHSDPPLIASDGHGWLVAWTQAGGRKPGLYVRAATKSGPEGPVRTIVESSVSLCPRLVWTGDAYVVGWREGDGLYLGRLGSHGWLADAPQRLIADAASIEDCRVAWHDGELGVAWMVAQGEARTLELARVSPTGDVRERVQVRTDAPPGAGPVDLAWHDGAWVVAYTSSEHRGARTVRVIPGGGQAPGPSLAREGFVRGLSLASPSWLGAVWSETTHSRQGANKARIFFDLLGGSGGPLELGAGRPRVDASARDHALAAATWSSVANGGTVHWVVLRFRRDHQGTLDVQPVTTEISADAEAAFAWP